jgi:sulfite oxidase
MILLIIITIILGAGAAIEPFWHTYKFHTEPKILNMLEKYRIGNLRTEDRASVKDQGDPYSDEPERNENFVVRSKTPFNAEPALSKLVENFITPVENFYGEHLILTLQ